MKKLTSKLLFLFQTFKVIIEKQLLNREAVLNQRKREFSIRFSYIQIIYVRLEGREFETGPISRLRRNPRGTSLHPFFLRPAIGTN